MKDYDLIVIGSGAAGMIAAIKAAQNGKNVLILEKLSQLGSKLKATGGGRCNLTNTFGNEEFMSKFGRNGRFMRDALTLFDRNSLQEFFHGIGVQTHAPDGFRIFPIGHNAQTILTALQDEMQHLQVEIRKSQKAVEILHNGLHVSGVKTQDNIYSATNVIVATGGLGYPMLGAEGDGYELSRLLGHTTTQLYPAMMPLCTKEKWVENCRADTIAKALLQVDMKKYNKLKATGDLIFTKNGIRGPVVLDFAREITPLLSEFDEVPIIVNLIKGMNEDTLLKHFKDAITKSPQSTIKENLLSILPLSLIDSLCSVIGLESSMRFNKLEGRQRAELLKIFTATPLTINGHEGFKMAMITRGGISLKEIDPATMQSKLVKGLYFCGEVMDIDGPCGGYNLQWAFSSGYLAGSLLE